MKRDFQGGNDELFVLAVELNFSRRAYVKDSFCSKATVWLHRSVPLLIALPAPLFPGSLSASNQIHFSHGFYEWFLVLGSSAWQGE